MTSVLRSLVVVVLTSSLCCAPKSEEPRNRGERPDKKGSVESTTLDRHQASDQPLRPQPEEGIVPEVDTRKYSLKVKPELTGDGSVRLSFETNVPGTVEVMANLSLKDQKQDDVWIGKSERVRLASGVGDVVFSTDSLPTGAYTASATLYPRWGLKDARSRAAGLAGPLSSSARISLLGSGEPAQSAQYRENAQKWVMLNVSMGDPWVPSDWIGRYGKFQEIPITQGNPRVLKAFYFSKIDMTLIVNTLQGEITIWRLGRQGS
ncbi:MAG: hypothetical protein AAGN66_00615 [Acidobacteriota bacterium]